MPPKPRKPRKTAQPDPASGESTLSGKAKTPPVVTYAGETFRVKRTSDPLPILALCHKMTSGDVSALFPFFEQCLYAEDAAKALEMTIDGRIKMRTVDEFMTLLVEQVFARPTG